MRLHVDEGKVGGAAIPGSKEEILEMVLEMARATFPCPHCGKQIRQASPERQRAIEQYTRLAGLEGKRELAGDLERMPFAELKKLLLEVFEGLKGFGIEVLDFEEEVDRRMSLVREVMPDAGRVQDTVPALPLHVAAPVVGAACEAGPSAGEVRDAG